MEFGDRLKEIRTGLNYSQTDLSEKTGLTLRTIQRIENKLNNRPRKRFGYKTLKQVYLQKLTNQVKGAFIT